MSNFQPNPEFVESLENLLVSASSGQGNHRESLQQIQNLQSNADFFSYCAAIMANETRDEKMGIRYQATLQIKNGMMNQNCGQNDVVRHFTLQTLSAPEEGLQRLVGSIVAAAIFRSAWNPEILSQILDQLENAIQQGGTCGGYIRAIFEVVDQMVVLIDQNISPRILQIFIPNLNNPNLAPSSRKSMLEAVELLLEQAGIKEEESNAYGCLDNNHDLFMQLLNFLGEVCQSQDEHAVQHGIRCLYLLFTFEKKMNDFFEQMAKMMLHQLANIPVEAIKLEVVEFWRAVLRRPNFLEKSLGVMPDVLNLILNYIVYSKDELGQLSDGGNDWQVPDKAEDLRPKNFRIDRAKKNVHKEEGGGGGDENNNNEAQDDYGDDDDDEVEEWTVRNAATYCLDELAQQFSEKMLEPTLNHIQQRLGSSDWLEIDSGVTALGSISTGCGDFMDAPLKDLIPRMCQFIQNDNTHFLLKQNAIWVLGRYAEFILREDGFLSNVLPVICNQMANSTSKLVQAACVLALDEICDAAEEHQLDEFAVPLVETVATCFGRFQLKNRYVLFEAIDYLCYGLGQALADENVLSKLTTPLSRLWEETPDDSPLIFPLFAGMSGICSSVGAMIQPLAPTLFSRSIAIMKVVGPLRANAIQAAGGNEDEADLPPDTEEFLVSCVDLLSGLFEALGTSMEPLISNEGADNVMQMFLFCADEASQEVRASAFGCLGEMSKSCVGFIQGHLPKLHPLILKHLGVNNEALIPTVASNIAWMLQNLLSCQNEAAGPTLEASMFDDIFKSIAYNIVKPPEDSRNMQENFCVLMGLMAQIDPSLIPRLAQRDGISMDNYLKQWLDVMRSIAPTSESQRAVWGFLNALHDNPQAAGGSCAWPLFDIFASLPKDMSMDLRQSVTNFLNKMKQGMGNNWKQVYGDYRRKRQLFQVYGVN